MEVLDSSLQTKKPQPRNLRRCLARQSCFYPKKRLDRRLEEVSKAVGGGYCWLQMPLRLALAVRETVARHRLGALERPGGGGYLPPFQRIPGFRIFLVGLGGGLMGGFGIRFGFFL